MASLNQCQNCGREIPLGAGYCPNCGAQVSSVNNPVETAQRWRHERRRRPEDDWWGVVTAAGFFVIIGLTIFAYPDVFSRIIDYLESFATYGHPVLPPYSLGEVIIYFFYLSGIWGLIAAGLRFALTNRITKPTQDVVGALFALYIGNSFSMFYAGAYGGWGLLGTLILGLAVVIIASALIGYFVPRAVKTETLTGIRA